MDEKILIYIIIGIIYFLFNRLKKKEPEEQEVERPNDQPTDSNRPRPVTFEELLREITEGKQQQQQPEQPVFESKPQYRRQEPEPEPAYVDYDDEIEAEEKSLEKVTFDQERTNEIYEQAKKMAFNRPSLEESLKLADVNTSFGKFK